MVPMEAPRRLLFYYFNTKVRAVTLDGETDLFDILAGVLQGDTLASIYSTSTRPGEGAIYRYLSRQGKIAGDIHETKSSGLSLS